MGYLPRVQIWIVCFQLPRFIFGEILTTWADLRLELVFYNDLYCTARIVADGATIRDLYEFDMRPLLRALFDTAPQHQIAPLIAPQETGPAADHGNLIDTVKGKGKKK